MRSLDELLSLEDPAWPLVQEWLKGATNPVEVLPPTDPDRAEALMATQVTTRSFLGAMIYESGGLLIDHGWLRVLGSGHPRLPRTLPDWNLGRTMHNPGASPPFLLVADDVLGGCFAINGGGLGPALSELYYFAPDNLIWEPLGFSYGQFVWWCLNGNLGEFYGDYRWAGWEEEVAHLAGDQGLLIYPFLWAAGPPIGERAQRVVPLVELYELHGGKEPL